METRSEPTILHEDALNSLFEMMDISPTDFREALAAEETALTPHQLNERLLEIYFNKHPDTADLLSPYKALLLEVMNNRINIDRGFQMYARDEAPLMIAAAHTLAQETDHHLGLLGIDISNLKGANNLIGENDKVNRILTRFMNIISHHVGEMGGEILFIRTGGDEIKAIVSGLEDVAMEEMTYAAQQEIETEVRDLGLDRIIHPKYPGNPGRAGFGLGMSFVMLDTEHLTEEKIEHYLDHSIENGSKVIRGERRAQKGGEVVTELTKEQKAHIDAMLNAPLEETYDAIPLATSWPGTIALEQSIEIMPYGSREQICHDAIEKQASREHWDESVGELLHQLVEFNHRPGAFGIQGTRYLREDMSRFIEHSAQEDPDKQAVLTQLHVQNMAGLNKAFDHYITDHEIIHPAIERIKEALPEGEHHLYYRGRGNITILSHGVKRQKLHQKLDAVARELDEEMQAKTIRVGDKTIAIHSIQNPRVDRKDVFGTGLQVTTMQLSEQLPPEAYLEALERIQEGEVGKRTRYWNEDTMHVPWGHSVRGQAAKSGEWKDAPGSQRRHGGSAVGERRPDVFAIDSIYSGMLEAGRGASIT